MPGIKLCFFYVFQLPKIELDKTEVREKDVHLANIYENQMFILVILHPLASASSTTATTASQTPSTDIHMYYVTKEGTSVTRTHILVKIGSKLINSSSIITVTLDFQLCIFCVNLEKKYERSNI
jgi:hypothetical protein